MAKYPTKKLGEVADYINGRAFKPTEWGEIGLPIIRIQNLTETQEKFNYFNGKLEDRYLVKNGDILLSWSASLGVYIWDKGDAALNQHIFKVIPHKDINKSYLFYSLIVAVEELKRRVHGSTMTHVTKPVFNRVTTKVPPLQIQKQIVERMDKIVEAQKLNDEFIQKSDELFQSLLHQELNPGGKDWEIKSIGEVCKIVGGGTPSREELKHFKGEIPWVTVKDLHVLEIEDTLEHINKESLKNCAANLVPANTVLVATRVGLGKVAIARKPLTFNQDIKGLIANDNIDAGYLFYIVLKNAGKIEKNGKGATVKGVTQEFLKSIKIPLPPLQTQKQIVAKLSAAQDYKKQLLAQKSLLKELFDSVLAKCMAGKLIN